MENKKDNSDIEELNLNDVEIEIKPQDINLEIKPIDNDVENLDFNEENSSLRNNTDNNEVVGKEDSSNNTSSVDNKSAIDGDSDIIEDDSNGSQDSEDLTSSDNGIDNLNSESNQPDTYNGDSNSTSNDGNSNEKENTKSSNSDDNSSNSEKKETSDKNNEGTQKKENQEDRGKNQDDKQDQNNKKDQDDKQDQNNKKNQQDKESKKDKNEEKPKTNNNENKKNSGNKSGQNRNSLKDRWNNRPKNPKDFANRAKNGIKNGAKNRFNNSKAGQAINKGKKAVEAGKKAVQGAKKAATAVKTAVSFFSTPAGWITLAVVAGLLLILVIAIMVPSLFASGSPLLGGEVSDEENYSKYSEVDQETIDKLKDITDDYVNGDPAFAMVAVVYPYIEELQGGNVSSLRGKTNVEQQDEEEEQDDQNSSQNNEDSQDDTTDLEDNQNDITADDPYLELFRKWTYRNKFKKLLKETEKGEESYIEYLKNSYFDSDKGYKELFDGCEDEEALADAIIDDLLELKEDFEGYFFEVCVTSVSFETAGQVDLNEMLYSPIYVDVKDAGCGTLGECDSYYEAPITLEKYVKGVVYEELGSSDNLEQIKAQMVAVKSYALSRHLDDVGVMDDGSYVIQMLWSTRDQDYCDYETGCMDVKENYGYNSPDDSLYKHYANREAASADKVALYDQAWEETKDYYIIDSNNITRGSYMNTCDKGTCMAQSELETITDMDYKSILAYFYTSYSFATIEGEHATAIVGSSTEACGENVNGGIPDSEFKFYYQTDYPDVAFCGAKDWKEGCPSDGKNTICTSGCGVTSYAMVIATLSDTENTFDPIAANDEATSSGGCVIEGGTNNNLFTNIANNHSGFTYENIPVTLDGAQQVLEALKNGGLVVANVQAASPFTNGGHWIVIRGITEEGMVKVADPNSSTITTTEVYDINDFINNNWLVDSEGTTHSWIAIYGPKSEEFKYAAAGVATGTLGYPVEGVTGCDASDYPYYSDGSYHGGTDMNRSVGAKEGMNILAADGGTVKTVKNLNYSYGSHVIIDHGNGYTTLYAHMQKDSIVVKEGDLVSKGQLIGKLGSTGNSTGPHLHIELRINNSHTNTLNPCEYIGQNKSYVNK